MHSTTLATFFEFSRTAFSMSVAGIVIFLIALWAVKTDLSRAAGLEKIVALSNLCFAMPLAVFGAEHFAAAEGISQLVPRFMPWHLFWTYFVGVALLAASLSIATRVEVRWAGLMFGIMMFLFVAMMDLRGTLKHPDNRFYWTLMFRELSFGSGGWCLASAAMDRSRSQASGVLFTVAHIIIGLGALLYAVEHFLHPYHVPGVPLEMLMPTWIPARAVISYLTGIILLVAGAAILLARKTRTAATCLGAWLFLIVLVIYGPILIVSLLDPSTDVKVEGLNYFFDAQLYAGTILALASAAPRTD